MTSVRSPRSSGANDRPGAVISIPVQFPGVAFAHQEAPSLEGNVSLIQDGELHPGVVLCHANPKGGGNMEMALIRAIEGALVAQGMCALRYNSRGVGGSAGRISGQAERKLVAPEGEPETADVGAALNFLARQEEVDPSALALVGHSFGARILLVYLEEFKDERVRAVTCVGLPVRWRDLSHLGRWPRPKLFVTGERDDFCPPGDLARYVDQLPAPSSQLTIQDTGHFFEGREDEVGAAIATFLSEALRKSPAPPQTNQ